MEPRIRPALALSSPLWLISQDAARQVQAIARDPQRYVPKAYWDDEDRSYGPSKPKLDVRDGVSVISVSGPIYGRETMLNRMMAYVMGGCSTDWIREQIRASLGSQDVKSILTVWDTPGGDVAETSELAETIREASEVKPFASYIPNQCCSKGYWLSSATGEITAHKSAQVGSVGVVVIVYDDTEYQKNEGIIEIPIVSSQSPDKWPDINTDAGRLLYQELADGLGEVFISSVAGFRAVDEATVLDDFGRGWVLSAEEAKRVGMIDFVGSLDSVLKKMSGPNRGKLAKSRPFPQVAASQSNLVSLQSIDQDLNLIGGHVWQSHSEGLAPAWTIPSGS